MTENETAGSHANCEYASKEGALAVIVGDGEEPRVEINKELEHVELPDGARLVPERLEGTRDRPIAKEPQLCWFVVDQMGVERAAELMVGVDGQRRRKVNRSSVVVGEDLSTRDGKVKVSAKKNNCSRTDQKSCAKSCEGIEMANGCATTLLLSNTLLYKIYHHVIDK